MKKFILLLTLIVTGCANLATTSFDNLEYDKYIQISLAADNLKNACDKPLDNDLLLLSYFTTSAMLYSNTKGESNARISFGTEQIVNMVAEMNNRYSQSVIPSKAYCVTKLTTISEAALKIATSLAKKEQ